MTDVSPPTARLDVSWVVADPGAEERVRLTALFRAAEKYRIVVVCAPVGSGKTSAARHFAARCSGTVAFARFSPGTSFSMIDHMLSETREASAVVIDDFDAAEGDVVEASIDRVGRMGDVRKFILIGTSRSRMRAHSLIAFGMATSIGAAELAFDREELARLAAAHDVRFTEDEIVQFAHDTDGWPLVASWILRDTSGAPLRGAYEKWCQRRGHLLLEFLIDAYQRDRDSFNFFRASLLDKSGWGLGHLEEFEALGLPLLRTRASFRPYRILSRLARPDFVEHDDNVSESTLMNLNLLGRFRCEIDSRPLNFRRRRDRNVFSYVALAPEGRTTREQLVDAFWPETNRAVATQGLRTTLSRIRVAIAEIAGAGNVDRYFVSNDDVQVKFTHIACDARRFVDHVRHGAMEAARGASESAKHHYAAAERIYVARLLSAESIEPCFLSRVNDLERLFMDTLTRLIEMYSAEDNYGNARACGARLLERAQDDATRERTMVLFDAAESALA